MSLNSTTPVRMRMYVSHMTWSHDLMATHPVLGLLQCTPLDQLHHDVRVEEVRLDEAGGEDGALVLEEHHRQEVIANVTLLAHLVRGEGGWLTEVNKMGHSLH